MNFQSHFSFKEKMLFSIGTLFMKIAFKLNFFQLQRTDNFFRSLKKLGMKFEKQELCLKIIDNNRDIFLRQRNSSDSKVFKQIFFEKEYYPVIDCILANDLKIDNIIDAGSNIGLTTLFLLNYFPNAKIVCLEPDPGNFDQLKKNLLKYDETVTFLNKALWFNNDPLYLDTGFRDGNDWAKSVTRTKASNTKVDSTTIHEISSQFNFQIIDILKIDIEGSENELFKMENNINFLNMVKVLVIEIHDEFNCRDRIYNILKTKNFFLFNSGELTIAINGEYI